jgi:hypothetical protein
MAVEDNYARFADLPYHNNLHAADVVHSIYVLLQTPCIRPHLSPLEVWQGG